jgi:hypothetical protein
MTTWISNRVAVLKFTDCHAESFGGTQDKFREASRYGKQTHSLNEGEEMGNNTCPALVDGKACGLELVLVEQDIDTETEVYECPLGHRKYVLLGEIEKRNCPTLVDGKACGLALAVVEREAETATEIYECPLGHRTYVPLEPLLIDDSC